MDILFRRGQATVAEVMDDLPDPPTAVPRPPRRSRSRTPAVRTFFDGSAEQAVTALLRISDGGLDAGELARLRERVRQARKSGR